MGVRCFLLEPTPIVQRTLRRYRNRLENGCPGKYGYHNAEVVLGLEDAVWRRYEYDADGRRWSPTEETVEGVARPNDERDWRLMPGDTPPAADPAWPRKCDYCEYVFGEADARQANAHLVYRRTDGVIPNLMPLADAPPGAMWFAWWMPEWRHQLPEGLLVVRLPDGHDWMPDMEATNCTRKGDQTHWCWVLHGTAPDLTADKIGETCTAGAGSIASGGWHGFLQNGELV